MPIIAYHHFSNTFALLRESQFEKCPKGRTYFLTFPINEFLENQEVRS